MKKLKLIASYVCLITCLLLHRNFDKSVCHEFRNIIYIYIYISYNMSMFIYIFKYRYLFTSVKLFLISNLQKKLNKWNLEKVFSVVFGPLLVLCRRLLVVCGGLWSLPVLVTTIIVAVAL